jgi:hypothetical protein
MADLAEAAVQDRPRIFAIHGLYRSGRGGPILGWGLDFPEDSSAIFTDPTAGSLHHSGSAEQVLRLLSMVADVNLTWLDDKEGE